MKQKMSTNTPATKADLNNLEKRMEKKFIDVDKKFDELEKRMDKKFDEQGKKIDEKLDQRFTAFQNAFRAEIDYKFETFKEEMHATISQFTNRILTAIDPLLQELETRQQDRAISTTQISELRDITDNHEKRIRKLENS